MKLATNNAHFLSEERLLKALSEVVKRRSRVAPSSSPLASRWRSALTQSSRCSRVRVTTEPPVWKEAVRLAAAPQYQPQNSLIIGERLSSRRRWPSSAFHAAL